MAKRKDVCEDCGCEDEELCGFGGRRASVAYCSEFEAVLCEDCIEERTWAVSPEVEKHFKPGGNE